MSTYNIDYDAHYFIPLEKVETIVSFGDGSGFSISRGDMALTECTISEGMYGKVDAVPVGYENGIWCRPKIYYASDFISLLREGIIIKKESETQHVEIIDEWEPLTNNTHIVHSRYAVVE